MASEIKYINVSSGVTPTGTPVQTGFAEHLSSEDIVKMLTRGFDLLQKNVENKPYEVKATRIKYTGEGENRKQLRSEENVRLVYWLNVHQYGPESTEKCTACNQEPILVDVVDNPKNNSVVFTYECLCKKGNVYRKELVLP